MFLVYYGMLNPHSAILNSKDGTDNLWASNRLQPTGDVTPRYIHLYIQSMVKPALADYFGHLWAVQQAVKDNIDI